MYIRTCDGPIIAAFDQAAVNGRSYTDGESERRFRAEKAPVLDRERVFGDSPLTPGGDEKPPGNEPGGLGDRDNENGRLPWSVQHDERADLAAPRRRA